MHQVVMCRPDNFDVIDEYPDNRWMNRNVKPDKNLKLEQWTKLLNNQRANGVNVYTICDQPELYDMTFVANAGLPLGDHFILSNFLYERRKPEKEFFRKFFEQIFEIHELSSEVTFEGQGDTLLVEGKYLLIGCNNRTSKTAFREIEGIVKSIDSNIEVIPLYLRHLAEYSSQEYIFYHMDTCLTYCQMTGEFIVYPRAFSEDIYSKIHKIGRIIKITEAEAETFICNSVVKDNIVFSPAVGDSRIIEHLTKEGYNIIQNPMSEFKKSGGAVKCLTLELD